MISKISDPTTGDIYSLVLNLSPMTSKTLSTLMKDLDSLNDTIISSGVRLTFTGAEAEPHCIVSFTKNIVKRNAGKKRSIGHAHTVSEVFVFRKTHTSAESADFAGVSIRTYQRRVNKYKSLSRWHEDNHLYF